MADEQQMSVAFSELGGKLDLLSSKMDAKVELVLQKIDSGDRESMQIAKLLEAEMKHLQQGQEDLSKRLTNIATESQRETVDVRTKVESLEAFRSSIKGTIALLMVLMPILTALIIKALTNVQR